MVEASRKELDQMNSLTRVAPSGGGVVSAGSAVGDLVPDCVCVFVSSVIEDCVTLQGEGTSEMLQRWQEQLQATEEKLSKERIESDKRTLELEMQLCAVDEKHEAQRAAAEEVGVATAF